MLGSKILGTNVLELQFVLCWQTMIKTLSLNHDQNIKSRFRLAQSMFICKIGIECIVGFIG